jgi:DNA-binding NarL/FixJ family response regulator
MKHKLVVADDHSLYRYALCRLLNNEPQCEVVEDAADGREAVEAVLKHRPNILITDIVMPTMNGIEAIRQALSGLPDLKVLVVSGYCDSRHVDEALEAGASGFMTKGAKFSDLLQAIDAISLGKSYLSPGITDVVLQRYIRGNGRKVKSNSRSDGLKPVNGNGSRGVLTLTRREREVLQLLAEGLVSKEIAAELSVSVKTIDTHRAAVMRKLDLNSVAHLTKYALREGITTLEY